MVNNVSYLKMRWEKKENQRYYEAWVSRDLFGWVVTRIWGRKGTSLGQVTHRPCDSFNDGKTQVLLIDKQRQQRGYSMVIKREVE